jgi:hypothetical protein
MNVSELISELRKFDPQLRAVVDGYEGGLDDILMVVQREIALNVNDPGGVYGEHSADRMDMPDTPAVHIQPRYANPEFQGNSQA